MIQGILKPCTLCRTSPMYVTFTVNSARHPHGTWTIPLSAAVFPPWHGSWIPIA